MTINISASLLAADFARLGEDVILAEKAGVDAFHFDMMDGHYVPNIAFSPQHLLDLRKYTNLPFQLHLELSNPDQVLDEFHELDADIIFVQLDTLKDPLSTFRKIKERGASIGLSINPKDDLLGIKGYLDKINMLLLLSVNPGFGGQPIYAGMGRRIRTAKIMVAEENPQLPMAIDGGVKLLNSKELTDSGADWLIIGSALFGQKDMTGFVQKIKNYDGQ